MYRSYEKSYNKSYDHNYEYLIFDFSNCEKPEKDLYVFTVLIQCSFLFFSLVKILFRIQVSLQFIKQTIICNATILFKFEALKF